MDGRRDPSDGTLAFAGPVQLAQELGAIARGEDEEGRLALAFALVNRISERWAGPDRDLALALSAVCRALSGAEPDPTHGATQFHSHTECPDWATNQAPTALIGGHLFYAPRTKGP
ncbi:cell wall hydrolase [Parvibaculum sp.]|jgi:hypothetical protein|uniref:cell wall hydrolase n=1 Tax=Parvibaculum sp. TaxID=2024848 RepID=UPI001B12C8E8|nr:cell wall hydrolase [Parvibaculum sp.]MBO6678650.1 cell wall hydrolase [Parvibaculum sp.]MBO6684262.1 cell wall hydrolase [Parvibaculum sp.]MBO6906383.1 cell wall hydrolase [Parvibaculum sp.]